MTDQPPTPGTTIVAPPPYIPPLAAGTYTIEATDVQNQALLWVAGEGNDPAKWLQDRNNEILDTYVRSFNLATTPVPTIDIATAYAYGTPEQQAAVVSALGLDQGTVVTPMSPAGPVVDESQVQAPAPPPQPV